ncbi:phage protein [Staphylococcus aureus]|nr:phage protein [Staphylococcus aureus]
MHGIGIARALKKDLINEFGKDGERVKFGMELNNKTFYGGRH